MHDLEIRHEAKSNLLIRAFFWLFIFYIAEFSVTKDETRLQYKNSCGSLGNAANQGGMLGQKRERKNSISPNVLMDYYELG